MRFVIDSESWTIECRDCDKIIKSNQKHIVIDNEAFLAHYHLKCAKKIYANLGRIIAKIEKKMKEADV